MKRNVLFISLCLLSVACGSDKADDVYQEAINKSGYEPKDGYVDGLQFMYFPNGLRGSVAVQSTRSTSAHKSFSIDKDGNMTAY